MKPVAGIALVACTHLAAWIHSDPTVKSTHANEVIVAVGSSIQAAIDTNPPGSVIRLAEGAYPERITIEKPVTIVGAGWEKTIIGSDAPTTPAPDRSATEGAQPGAPVRPMPMLQPTLTVKNTTAVTLQGFRIRGPKSLAQAGTSTEEALVVFDAAAVTMSECVVLGPSMNGVAVVHDSDVRLERCLVAALWGTGVQVRGSKEPRDGAAARVHILECELRNCCYSGVTSRGSDIVVERCRISGSAWHGIRYDNCSPTIRANQIFGNCGSGIYASGETAARISSNVFWRNENSGMRCWYANRDSIEGNTFVGHLGGAIAVLAEASPTITKNLLVENLIAVQVGNVVGEPYPGSHDASTTIFSKNLFFENASDFKVGVQLAPLPDGNATARPNFVAQAEHDFTLAPDSYARKVGAGVADPIPFAGPFPIQPEETAMIPDRDSRHSSLWKR